VHFQIEVDKADKCQAAAVFDPRLSPGMLPIRFIWWDDGFRIFRVISGDSDSRAERAGDRADPGPSKAVLRSVEEGIAF
jgi:hypothetical protein